MAALTLLALSATVCNSEDIGSNSLDSVQPHLTIVRSAKPQFLSEIALSSFDFRFGTPELHRQPEFARTVSQTDSVGALRHSEEAASVPRSGGQLYVQRLAALRTGQLYTRLPANSFREWWQYASVQPTLQDWRSLLTLEAQAVASGQGNQRLSVLLGDSISLWFPSERLPKHQLWLNQGISGDTTWNILSRLSVFANTRPDQIYVMAGINDLKLGALDVEVLSNLREIARRLRSMHPHAKIILQSILPTRLPGVTPKRIEQLNQQMATIAQQEGAEYLDLFSQFVNQNGELSSDYTTDGLHLNAQGYEVWQSRVERSEIRIAQVQ